MLPKYHGLVTIGKIVWSYTDDVNTVHPVFVVTLRRMNSMIFLDYTIDIHNITSTMILCILRTKVTKCISVSSAFHVDLNKITKSSCYFVLVCI